MGARQETAGRSGGDGAGNPAALGMVGIQETYDPCHWERVSQPWEVMATPLGAGPFHNRKTFLATPNCILYHESFGSRMRVHALSPEGMFCCAVQVRSGDHTSYFNRPLHERGLPIMLPGAAEAVLDAGQEHIMILLRQSLLRRYLDIEQVATLESAAATHLLPACNKTVTRLGAWLTELLGRTHRAPEMLRHPAAVESVERELVTGLADALQLRKPRRAPRLSLRQRGFDRAIEYIRQADLAALDPAALCAAAAVSPRTLEYAFQESLGLSPAVFIRRLAPARVAPRAAGQRPRRIHSHRPGLSPGVHPARPTRRGLPPHLRRAPIRHPRPALPRRRPAPVGRLTGPSAPAAW